MLPVIMSGDKPTLLGELTACQLSPKIQNSESVSKKFNAKCWLEGNKSPPLLTGGKLSANNLVTLNQHIND